MGVFMVLILVAVIFGILAYFTREFAASIVPFGISTAATVVLLISSIPAAVVHVTKPMNITANQIRYNSLCYQLEHANYGDDVAKYELYCDIEAWNSDLKIGKDMRGNFWVGVYWTDMYDMFNYLPYPD